MCRISRGAEYFSAPPASAVMKHGHPERAGHDQQDAQHYETFHVGVHPRMIASKSAFSIRIRAKSDKLPLAAASMFLESGALIVQSRYDGWPIVVSLTSSDESHEIIQIYTDFSLHFHIGPLVSRGPAANTAAGVA